MAGSISLSLSQQFDELGKPLSGGLLYFIQAGTTSTPQNAYQDTALTIPHPNPITLSAAGRVPAFYLADGQIKIRLTDSTGVNQIVQDNLLVIGPSSGEGGGGGGVDPTTVFQTGDVMWLDVSGSRSGWVRDNGRTIGSATSGATERASADCEALFGFLWQKFPDTICPVSGGRGANAAADWAANKAIQLPDRRCAVAGGLADMGNTDSGDWDDVPAETGDATTAGSIIGENLHALIKAELPAVSPTATTTSTASPNDFLRRSGSTAVNFGGDITFLTALSQAAPTITSTTTVAPLGTDTPHNTAQRTVLGTFYRKL